MQSELQDVEGLIDLTDHIEVLDQKTSGGFGCIYQGRHKTENFLVALKIPFLRSQGHPEDKLRKVSAKFLIRVFIQISHPLGLRHSRRKYCYGICSDTATFAKCWAWFTKVKTYTLRPSGHRWVPSVNL